MITFRKVNVNAILITAIVTNGRASLAVQMVSIEGTAITYSFQCGEREKCCDGDCLSSSPTTSPWTYPTVAILLSLWTCSHSVKRTSFQPV